MVFKKALKNEPLPPSIKDLLQSNDPKAILHHVLVHMRSIRAKTNAETEKVIDSKPNGEIEKVLEDLYIVHLNAHKDCINASQQVEALDNEAERFINEYVTHDETLKRLIHARGLQKSGQAILSNLQNYIKAEAAANEQFDAEISERLALVSQQSKEILASKLTD